MKVKEIVVKSALHNLKKSRLPFDWDLNIYRGCAHNCEYCYARYSHKYFSCEDDFFDTIFVKANILDMLERELKRKSWRREVINLGGVCDSYQPIEAKYKLMRGVLKLMIKYRNPVIISTKSRLILRDLDLLAELSKVAYVGVAVTVTSFDNQIARILERGASDVEDRFYVLREIKDKTDCKVGLHVMPILPYITDDSENLERLFHKAKELGVDYCLTGGLYLRTATKKHFLEFIDSEYPYLSNKYRRLYNNTELRRDHFRKVNSVIRKFRVAYSVDTLRNFPKTKTEGDSTLKRWFS